MRSSWSLLFSRLKEPSSLSRTSLHIWTTAHILSRSQSLLLSPVCFLLFPQFNQRVLTQPCISYFLCLISCAEGWRALALFCSSIPKDSFPGDPIQKFLEQLEACSYRIIEYLRLDKALKIIKSNLKVGKLKWAKLQ